MADSAYDALSNISGAGVQKGLSAPGLKPPYMDEFELRIMNHIQRLLQEQTKELMEHHATHVDDMHGKVKASLDMLGDQMKTAVSMLSMDNALTQQPKKPAFTGFIYDSEVEQDRDIEEKTPKRTASEITTDLKLRSVIQAGEHSRLQKVTESNQFRFCALLLIMLQSAVLGWESSLILSIERERLEGTRSDSAHPNHFLVIEHVFMVLFGLEWLFRVLAWRRRFLDRTDWEIFAWNLFDTILVSSSLLIFFDLKVSWLRSIRLFRMARILRIFRLAKKLRKMSYALARAIDSMIWLVVLLSLMLYVFSLVVMRAAYFYMRDIDTAQYQELEHGDPDIRKDLSIILERFGSLESTMLSLLASFTGGAEWDSLFKPIMSVSPLYYIVVLFFVFLFVFAVMNVVTGVFVEDAMKIAITDESLAMADVIESQEKFESDVERFISTIDDDNDGLINCDQLLEALGKKSVQNWLAVRDIDLSVENARRIMQIFQEHVSDKFDSNVLLKSLHKLQGAPRRTDLIVTAHDLRDGQKALQRSLEAIGTCYTQIANLESKRPTRFSDDETKACMNEISPPLSL